MIPRKAVLVAGAFAVLSLGGCISLFPKSKPAELYRFGVGADGVASTASTPARSYNVSRATTVFNRAALGDRMLTVTGAQTAYIKDARWVAPASILFDEALVRAFEAAPGCARLLTRGDPSIPQAILRVDVRTFEARYLEGVEAAPTAVVEAHVSMINSRDRTVLEDRLVRAERRATDNRVGAIVEALDGANAKVLEEITAGANRRAASQGCGRNPPR